MKEDETTVFPNHEPADQGTEMHCLEVFFSTKQWSLSFFCILETQYRSFMTLRILHRT